MTTAFITGIAGQDGTYLAERLAGEGCVVHGLVLDDGEAKAALSHAPGAVVHRGDLGDPDSIAALVKEIGPDEVYNLGGISSVAFSWEQPVLTGRVTGLGAVGVFEAARRAQDASGRPIRVVQASSSEVFGVPDKAPQDESTPIRPVSPYGAAKAYAHLAAAAYRARGLFVATCVFYNHESPRRPTTFVTRKITAAAARIARDGGTLTLGDLTARRDWGWAPDYVDSLVRAARHGEPDDFVVATGETHSVADFAAAAFARAGVADWRSHVLTDPELYRPADSTQLVGRADKARRVLGWAPTCSFDDLVARLVDADLAAL
ncbi:MAG: GDP-mannose 4,6-dehydratase [Propionibacteriaceae bacterium]|nr:GDP-mannose 4,6-dehydratase [Propionibacteriaceae bacterium]